MGLWSWADRTNSKTYHWIYTKILQQYIKLTDLLFDVNRLKSVCKSKFKNIKKKLNKHTYHI